LDARPERAVRLLRRKFGEAGRKGGLGGDGWSRCRPDTTSWGSKGKAERMFLAKLDLALIRGWICPSGDKTVALDPGEARSEEGGGVGEKTDRVLLVLEGEVHAEMAGESVRIVPGNAMLIPAGVAHRLCNNGVERARTVAVCAGRAL